MCGAAEKREVNLVVRVRKFDKSVANRTQLSLNVSTSIFVAFREMEKEKKMTKIECERYIYDCIVCCSVAMQHMDHFFPILFFQRESKKTGKFIFIMVMCVELDQHIVYGSWMQKLTAN